MTISNKKWHWVKANDSEWYNDRIRMRVSKIEWFYISKETKDQSGKSINFLNNFIQFSVQYITTIRTSRSQMFFEIGVLKVCNIYRSTPLLESLFSKVASLETYKFVKKRLQHRCFPVIIANFARKFYLKNTTSDCFCTWNSPRIWLHKSGNCWLYFQYNTLCLYYVFLHFSSFFSHQFCWSY